jgi:hypothetical protein
VLQGGRAGRLEQAARLRRGSNRPPHVVDDGSLRRDRDRRIRSAGLARGVVEVTGRVDFTELVPIVDELPSR